MVNENVKEQNLRDLLRLHWEHYRHIETERHWFMSVYTAITGTILAFILRSDGSLDGTGRIWILFFLMVFTLIGFMINRRWVHALGHFQNNIENLQEILNLPVKFAVPARGFWKILRTRHLFSVFYAIILAGLIALTIIG